MPLENGQKVGLLQGPVPLDDVLFSKHISNYYYFSNQNNQFLQVFL